MSLKRLSEQQQLQRGTYQTRFHLDHHVNRLIVEGSWRQLYDDATYTIAGLSQLIPEFYKLENDVTEALCFCYETLVGGQQRNIFLLANEMLEGKMVRTLQGEWELTIDDVTFPVINHKEPFWRERYTATASSCFESYQ
jgi:hypothetical protein